MATRVFSERGKSFREKLFFFREYFVFRSFAKTAKIFAFFTKFRFNLFREKMQKFSRNKKCKHLAKPFRHKCEIFANFSSNIFQIKEREIINYDIIKLQMLSSQSREFHKIICTINN